MAGLSAPALVAATISVPAIPAGEAIARLALQANVQLLYKPATVVQCQTHAITGVADPVRALRRMLAGCAIDVRRIAGGAIVIDPVRIRVAKVRGEDPVPNTGEDIVVTALKRETRIGMTAVSMSAIRGSDLEAAAQSDLRSLAAVDPNLAALDTGTGQQRLIMRGIYGNGEATVGVYYDETPVTGPVGTSLDPGIGAPDLELVDIDRIEMLRGPQGTLYGAGSMGGTVRILFNKPDLAHFGGTAKVGFAAAEHGQIGEQLSSEINLPIVTDRLAVRGVAYRRVSPGYIDDAIAGSKEGGRVVRDGGRLALSWAASDRLSIGGTVALQKLSAANNSGWYPTDGRYRNNQPVATPYDSRILLTNLIGHYDLGWAALTATASHYDWKQLRVYDYGSVVGGLRDSAAGCGRLFNVGACSDAQQASYATFVDSRLPALLYQPMRVRGESGEIRLASTEGGPIDWTTGLFAERRRDSVDSYALRANAQTGQVIRPFDLTGYRQVFYALSQKAVFGEATWHMPHRLDLIIGARHFDYGGSGYGTLIVPNIITGTGDANVQPLHTRKSGTSFKAELAWRPSPTWLAYLQAAQGFRPGGVNITPGITDDQRSYRSDHLWSYEAGLKYHPPAGRITVDADIYRVNWSDMIYKIRSANGAFAYNANIGSVDINGAEFEGRIVPWKGGDVRLGMSFVDARLAENQAQPSAAGIAHRGDRIPEVPRWSASGSLHHSLMLGGAMILRGGMTMAYTSAYASQFNLAMAYYERTPSRFIANLDLGLKRGSWLASIVIDNLFANDRPSTVLSDPYGQQRFYNDGPRTTHLMLSRTF